MVFDNNNNDVNNDTNNSHINISNHKQTQLTMMLAYLLLHIRTAQDFVALLVVKQYNKKEHEKHNSKHHTQIYERQTTSRWLIGCVSQTITKHKL